MEYVCTVLISDRINLLLYDCELFFGLDSSFSIGTMWSMRIEIPKACQVIICLSLDFNKFLMIQIIFIQLLIMISE